CGYSSREVRSYSIVYISEIAGLFAVTIDSGRLTLEHRSYEFCHHTRVGRIGILAWPEQIEITQADSLQIVVLGEAAHIEFASEFLHCVRRKRIRQHGFLLRQHQGLTISGA